MAPQVARIALCATFAAVTALSANNAEAKAAYMQLADAVQAAEAIAVVHTEATATTEVKAGHWTYRQKVFANPDDTLKGALTSPFELLAQKEFVCASVTYEAPADYLVLLAREDGHWTTVNHHMGAMKIEDGQVQWPYGTEHHKPLPQALAELRALIGSDAEPEPVEPATVEPEIDPTVDEPMPCGLVASQYYAEEPEHDESWPVVPLSMAGGALAILLGLVVGYRRRRR